MYSEPTAEAELSFGQTPTPTASPTHKPTTDTPTDTPTTWPPDFSAQGRLRTRARRRSVPPDYRFPDWRLLESDVRNEKHRLTCQSQASMAITI